MLAERDAEPEQLEYVPGRFKVIRPVRPTLACARSQGVFEALAPSRPITRGLPIDSASFIHELILIS